MPDRKFSEEIKRICKADPRYHRGAYHFVRAGLNATFKLLGQDGNPLAGQHVSGQQLLEGLRVFALDQFGPLTLTVLHHWGIHCCSDFGNIVFNLIEAGVFGKSEADDIADFETGYDFEVAFSQPFEPTQNNPDSDPF